MNENFWGKMSDEYLKNNPEPPPLTDELLAAFEKQIGLKLPKALTDLLRVKNGGLIRNTDFRFNGKDYQVTYIKAVIGADSYHSIRTYLTILDDPDMTEAQVGLQQKAGELGKLLYVAEALDGPDAYALNYNRLNSVGEPTVWRIALEYGETPHAKQIASSLEEFLAGQYFGDERPSVEMKDADKYRLLAEGSYTGTHGADGGRVEMAWKICLDGSRILVFQKENWGWGEKVTRMEIKRSQLQESYGVLDFLFGLYQRFALWCAGKEMGADLSQAANDKRICISNEDAPLKPKCFKLSFHTHNLGDELAEDSWIRIRTSELFEGRWKNWESKVWNDTIYSANKSELIQAQNAIVGIG